MLFSDITYFGQINKTSNSVKRIFGLKPEKILIAKIVPNVVGSTISSC